MFDLNAGVWTKPAAFTKQGRHHRVPLSSAARTILETMQKIRSGPYVFPGRVPDSPLTDMKETWEAVCIEAGLVDRVPKLSRSGKSVCDEGGYPILVARPNVRIHDLRHTFASLLVSSGKSLPLIGALLGQTQSQTTMRYAHLFDDARGPRPTMSAACWDGESERRISLPACRSDAAPPLPALRRLPEPDRCMSFCIQH